MGLTYTYATGQITRDFHFKKTEHVCQRDPARSVLIGVMCRTCPFYGGYVDWWGRCEREYVLNLDRHEKLVQCKFHQEDDPGLSEIVSEMYHKFEEEAITHYLD